MSNNVFGSPWAGDSVGNTEIGKFAGRLISIRFRAQASGSMTGVRVWLKGNDGGSGYALGDGGHVTMELRTNNPLGDIPTSTVLATVTVTDTDPANTQWRTLTFSSPATVTAGTLYHIVFYNPAADPVSNYVSLNALAMTTPVRPRQPWVSDQDLAFLTWDTNTAGRYWTETGRRTPIYAAIIGGNQYGVGLQNIASQSLLTDVGNANEVRQTMALTSTRVVQSVYLWLYKNGAPTQDLEVYIRDSAMNILGMARISPTDVNTTVGWVRTVFAYPLTLSEGSTYYLHLRCYNGGSTDYKIFPTQDGISQGFTTQGLFTEGKAQKSADRGATWTDVGSNTNYDWTFYFGEVY